MGCAESSPVSEPVARSSLSATVTNSPRSSSMVAAPGYVFVAGWLQVGYCFGFRFDSPSLSVGRALGADRIAPTQEQWGCAAAVSDVLRHSAPPTQLRHTAQRSSVLSRSAVRISQRMSIASLAGGHGPP